jgi:putative alpha-1,2-mannosidase
LSDESAAPGYYAATFRDTGIRMELSAAHQAAAHRYTLPAGDGRSLGLLVDATNAGLAPPRARSRAEDVVVEAGDRRAVGRMRACGVTWYFAIVVRGGGSPEAADLWTTSGDPDRTGSRGGDAGGWTPIERRGSSAPITLNATECGAMRAGAVWNAGDGAIEVYVALSLSSVERALTYAESAAGRGFDGVRADAGDAWAAQLGRVRADGGSTATRRIFATAVYHASLKPTRCEESNFLWRDGPDLWTGVATMWDQYKTQLPFVAAVNPEHMMPFVRSYLSVRGACGRFPNSVLFSADLMRNENQSRNLAVVTLYDFYRHLEARGEARRSEWEPALEAMEAEVEREWEAIRPRETEQGFSHLLDVTYAAGCVARLSDEFGRASVAGRMRAIAARWVDAFDPETGMVRSGEFYEGGNVHYSFRLLHDMRARAGLCGGVAGLCRRLDDFFGYGAEPVRQIGDGITQQEGMALGRFDGLNNEVMLETPFAYHYLGRPDRTSEIVHAIQRYQWSDTRGGIPGNEDSGALSSWYAWNAMGLYPVPGQDLFLVSVPLFDRVRIGRSGLVVEVERESDESIYLASLELDGTPLARTFITVAEFCTARLLRVRLASTPGQLRVDELPASRASAEAGV